jgi:hypothetical protein
MGASGGSKPLGRVALLVLHRLHIAKNSCCCEWMCPVVYMAVVRDCFRAGTWVQTVATRVRRGASFGTAQAIGEAAVPARATS